MANTMSPPSSASSVSSDSEAVSHGTSTGESTPPEKTKVVVVGLGMVGVAFMYGLTYR